MTSEKQWQSNGLQQGPLLPPLSHFFFFFFLVCTLMYKIAPIHKQNHYFHCLATLLPLSLSLSSPPFPIAQSSPPQTRTHICSSLRSYFQGIFCERAFQWSWLISKGVENCASSAAFTPTDYWPKKYIYDWQWCMGAFTPPFYQSFYLLLFNHPVSLFNNATESNRNMGFKMVGFLLMYHVWFLFASIQVHRYYCYHDDV